MTLGAATFDVDVGDTICIPPNTPHRIANTGTEALHILCACAPPYAHEDTEIM
jgi:mannose-6-phosphate isomerase-like protein (cupin superfamily)